MIHLGGQPPPDALRTVEGYSTGHWEGDTLVVQTTHLRGEDPAHFAANPRPLLLSRQAESRSDSLACQRPSCSISSPSTTANFTHTRGAASSRSGGMTARFTRSNVTRPTTAFRTSFVADRRKRHGAPSRNRTSTEFAGPPDAAADRARTSRMRRTLREPVLQPVANLGPFLLGPSDRLLLEREPATCGQLAIPENLRFNPVFAVVAQLGASGHVALLH